MIGEIMGFILGVLFIISVIYIIFKKIKK